MNIEQWYEQLLVECLAVGANPPLQLFVPAYFSSGMTPAECAAFLKSKQS